MQSHDHTGHLFDFCKVTLVASVLLFPMFEIILASLVWLFSTVRFEMFPQSASLDWCIVTVVALYVHFQMSPQIDCLSECKVTLPIIGCIYYITFPYVSNHTDCTCLTVYFQCLLKLPASQNERSHWLYLFNFSDVWKSNWLHFFSAMRFQMPLQIACRQPKYLRGMSLRQFGCIYSIFPHVWNHTSRTWLWLFWQCVFKCLFKLVASENAKSHWLHLFNFSPCLKTFDVVDLWNIFITWKY